MRIDKVYTKGGDRGQTSLIGGERVSKANPRIEAYGTVDELNATLGLVRTALETSAAGDHLIPILHRVQNELFNLGAELATPDPERRAKLPRVELRHVDGLERDIDALNDSLPPLTSFVLPGGGAASAHFHLARTVCRRGERLLVALGEHEDLGELPVIYLNRLSDALFVFGRWAAMKDGRLNKCIECTKADVRENRLNKIDHYRSFDRGRANLPHRQCLRSDLRTRQGRPGLGTHQACRANERRRPRLGGRIRRPDEPRRIERHHHRAQFPQQLRADRDVVRRRLPQRQRRSARLPHVIPARVRQRRLLFPGHKRRRAITATRLTP